MFTAIAKITGGNVDVISREQIDNKRLADSISEGVVVYEQSVQ
jgi:hypothetical protein